MGSGSGMTRIETLSPPDDGGSCAESEPFVLGTADARRGCEQAGRLGAFRPMACLRIRFEAAMTTSTGGTPGALDLQLDTLVLHGSDCLLCRAGGVGAPPGHLLMMPSS